MQLSKELLEIMQIPWEKQTEEQRQAVLNFHRVASKYHAPKQKQPQSGSQTKK